MARPACMVSLNDVADRAPRMLADGETIDLGGGKRVRYIDTPHTPHGWDAGVMFEESTGTLLCGDLFTQLGENPALTSGDIVGPAIEGEELVSILGARARHGLCDPPARAAQAKNTRSHARPLVSRGRRRNPQRAGRLLRTAHRRALG